MDYAHDCSKRTFFLPATPQRLVETFGALKGQLDETAVFPNNVILAAEEIVRAKSPGQVSIACLWLFLLVVECDLTVFNMSKAG